MTYVAAIDVGGTTMKGGLVTRDGTIHHAERRPTPRAGGPEEVVGAVAAFVADLARPRDGVRPWRSGSRCPGSSRPPTPSSRPRSAGGTCPRTRSPPG
ncbi:ROK family protein [Nonomuraea thailandensis]